MIRTAIDIRVPFSHLMTALMMEALGLGGFPNFARHEYSWFKVAGFRMQSMPASRYAGGPRVLSALANAFGRDPLLEYPIGLEKDNQALLKPFCPPYYKSMEDAVRTFVETKFGAEGSYRGGVQQSAWLDAAFRIAEIPAPSAAALQATIAYCDYVFRRYGRFPAYTAPFRTIIGFQVCRVDLDFYARFYDPEAVSDAVRTSTREILGNP
jgi:hypothetical protein